MNGTLLKGRGVKVRANEFIQTELAARVADVNEHDQKLLLNLATPLTISGVTYLYAIASPRLTSDDLNVLLSNGVLGCAVTWVPKNRFDHSNPFDLAWWRGGAAAVTDVTLTDRNGDRFIS